MKKNTNQVQKNSNLNQNYDDCNQVEQAYQTDSVSQG